MGLLAVALPKIVNTPEFRAALAARAGEALGTPVEWKSLTIGIFPPRVTLDEPVLVGQDVSAESAASIRAQAIDLRLSLLPLLERRIAIESLVLRAVALVVTRTPDGFVLPEIARRAAQPADAADDTPGDDPSARDGAFVLDLRAPGVQIRPIRLLSGHHHFNEVVMTDVFVADYMLLGVEGNGWSQVIGELAYERSGPERILSTYPLLAALVDAVGPDPSAEAAAELGTLVARMAALRRLCISVAMSLDAGRSPVTEAALVKDLGTQLEGEIPEVARRLVAPGHNEAFDQLVADSVLSAPGFTLRGGTNEILRGIVARELGVR